MQSSLEKAVEQSTASLRDRAAEISSLVASELDHYRRTYLEHSQAQIEETAKEVVERERNKLDESAEIANATFTDRVRRTTDESLRHFDQRLARGSRKSALRHGVQPRGFAGRISDRRSTRESSKASSKQKRICSRS